MQYYMLSEVIEAELKFPIALAGAQTFQKKSDNETGIQRLILWKLHSCYQKEIVIARSSLSQVSISK